MTGFTGLKLQVAEIFNLHPEQKHYHNHFIHHCLKVSHFNPMSHSDCTVCDRNKKRFPLLWVTKGGQTAFFILSFETRCLFQWDGVNANESAALPKMIFSFPPSTVSYCPNKSRQTQSMGARRVAFDLKWINYYRLQQMCSNHAVPNVAITDCWLKLIED